MLLIKSNKSKTKERALHKRLCIILVVFLLYLPANSFTIVKKNVFKSNETIGNYDHQQLLQFHLLAANCGLAILGSIESIDEARTSLRVRCIESLSSPNNQNPEIESSSLLTVVLKHKQISELEVTKGDRFLFFLNRRLEIGTATCSTTWEIMGNGQEGVFQVNESDKVNIPDRVLRSFRGTPYSFSGGDYDVCTVAEALADYSAHFQLKKTCNDLNYCTSLNGQGLTYQYCSLDELTFIGSPEQLYSYKSRSPIHALLVALSFKNVGGGIGLKLWKKEKR